MTLIQFLLDREEENVFYFGTAKNFIQNQTEQDLNNIDHLQKIGLQSRALEMKTNPSETEIFSSLGHRTGANDIACF